MIIIDRFRTFLLNRKIKKEGGQAFSYSLRKIYQEKYNIHIGYGSYGGCFDIKNIPEGTQFGNYCSIAQGVKVFRANHPYDYFTMHPVFYNPVMGYVNKDQLERPVLLVGNDVWIGANAIILPSVKIIGNGSIIGAGSVVTKNVPPYSIVAGNPAKIVKMRFAQNVIEKLEYSKWWKLEISELVKKREFLEKLVDGI